MQLTLSNDRSIFRSDSLNFSTTQVGSVSVDGNMAVLPQPEAGGDMLGVSLSTFFIGTLSVVAHITWGCRRAPKLLIEFPISDSWGSPQHGGEPPHRPGLSSSIQPNCRRLLRPYRRPQIQVDNPITGVPISMVCFDRKA